MHKLETSGSMLKWAMELSQFNIEYKPRSAIKRQALVDFILESPPEIEGNDMAIIPSLLSDAVEQ